MWWASPGYLEASLLWSGTAGADASSESHRQTPHKEIKDVIGRGKRKCPCSFSCVCSSEGKASRSSYTGLWISRMTFGSFCLLSKGKKAPANPKHGKILSRIKHDRKTLQRLCCCFTQPFSPALHLQGRSKRGPTQLCYLCAHWWKAVIFSLIKLKSLENVGTHVKESAF